MLERFKAFVYENNQKISYEIRVEANCRYRETGEVEPFFILGIGRSDVDGGNLKRVEIKDTQAIQNELKTGEDAMGVAILEQWNWVKNELPKEVDLSIEYEEERLQIDSQTSPAIARRGVILRM